MTAYVLITAISVSVDAWAAGVAWGAGRAVSARDLATVGLVTGLLCVVAQTFGAMLSSLHAQTVGLAGGVLLACIGARSLLPSVHPLRPIRHSVATAAGIGLAVGMDGAVAALSLSLMGNASPFIPLLFAATHAASVGLGAMTLSGLRHLPSRLAGCLLLVLGLFKTFSVLWG